MTAPQPFNEAFRQRALDMCDILDSGPDPEFDGIVDLARHRFDTPIAFVSLLDTGRQWFKAKIGPLPSETDREHAVCAHAILGSETLVIPDLAEDPRFSDNPLVVGEPGLRFYVGAPLILEGGFRVGTLCVCDTVPRAMPDPAAIESLRTLADLVSEKLERSARARLGETARLAKEDFLALMSHECRTPLNAIIGFCEMISLMSDDTKAQEYAGHALESSRHLLGLIDRVLTFSQVENGQLELADTRVDIASLLDDAVTAGKGVGRGRAAGDNTRDTAENAVGDTSLDSAPKVTLSIANDLPALLGDADHLSAMTRCLVHNAVDAAQSEVMVRACLNTLGDLEITVADDGPGLRGVAPSDILNPFEVGEDIYSRVGAGIGLGLPLTDRLAKLHGGDLKIEEGADSSGLRVTVVLPSWRIRAAA